MERKYSWKLDSYYGVYADANEVGKELEQIEEKDELTKEGIVEYAKNPDTELNKLFEWDDTIAGYKYRLDQASKIVQNIQVEVIGKNKDDEPKQVKAFVKVTKSPKEPYRNIEAVVSDAEKYAMLLEKAYKELNQTKNKYQELEEIQDLLKDIPEIY